MKQIRGLSGVWEGRIDIRYRFIFHYEEDICVFRNIDEFVKSRNSIESVIPAKAGIQLFQGVLDPGFRRGDDPKDFLRDHQYWPAYYLGT